MDHFDRQKEEFERMIDERRHEIEMREQREEERRRMIDPGQWRPSDEYRKFINGPEDEKYIRARYEAWREAEKDRYPIPRNSRGQVMYDEKCISCTSHKEKTMVCDLCKINQTVERTHVSKNNLVVEELPHHCKQAKQRLHNILYAIIF